MPCLAIHLAVAKKYLEKHHDLNHDDFIKGTLAPDLGMDNIDKYIKLERNDKDGRHFGLTYKARTITDYMGRKIDFKLFFKDNDINTSFLKAYFLHLLCDFYFFRDGIPSDKIKNLSLEESIRLGYNDYDLITPILINKYDLEVPIEAKEIMSRKGHGNLIFLNEGDVYKFIDEMSNLDLDDEKIKKTS